MSRTKRPPLWKYDDDSPRTSGDYRSGIRSPSATFRRLLNRARRAMLTQTMRESRDEDVVLPKTPRDAAWKWW